VKRIFCGLGVGLVTLILAGCGSLSPLAPAPQALPPLDAAKGRIVFYRTGSFGSPYAGDALLNGERVGRADRRGMYYVDVAPGSYAVTTRLSARVVNFSVAAGERKYLRFANDLLVKFSYPELVEPGEGERESRGLERLAR